MSENDTCFTKQWFFITGNDLVWSRFLHRYESRAFNYLEVGSYEGMSARWLASHFPLAQITCIDTFAGSDEHDEANDLEARFDFNLWLYRDRLTKLVGRSSDILPALPKDYYDIIYVDGDHHAQQVLEDAELSFLLLREGGLMIFDDYTWHPSSAYTEQDCPKLGIDTFLERHKGQYGMLHKEYQVIIRKKRG